MHYASGELLLLEKSFVDTSARHWRARISVPVKMGLMKDEKIRVKETQWQTERPGGNLRQKKCQPKGPEQVLWLKKQVSWPKKRGMENWHKCA